MKYGWTLFLFLLVLPGSALAKCADSIRIKLNEVHPTQSVIGKLYAEEKCLKFAKMSRAELNRYLQTELPPIVLGPGKIAYLLDSHHELYCLQKLGVEEINAQCIADFSRMRSMKRFESVLLKNGWLYLGDSHGEMTLTLETMPKSLPDMGDDPFRGFASHVRKAGGFKKVKKPQVEFVWGNALRKVVPLEVLLNHPELALELGVTFAKSAEAAGYPGYNGKFKLRRCGQWLDGSS